MNIGGSNISIKDITNMPAAADLNRYLHWLSQHYSNQFNAIEQAASPQAAEKLIWAGIKEHRTQQRKTLFIDHGVKPDTRAAATYNYDMINAASEQISQLNTLSTNYAATMQRAASYGISPQQMYLLDDVAQKISTGGEKNYSEHLEKVMADKSVDEKKRFVNEVLHSIEHGGSSALVTWNQRELALLKHGGYIERANELRRGADSSKPQVDEKQKIVLNNPEVSAPGEKKEAGIYTLDSKDNFGGSPELIEKIEATMKMAIDGDGKLYSDFPDVQKAVTPSEKTIRTWQHYLQDSGYPNLAVDGQMGGETRLATKTFLAKQVGYEGAKDKTAFNADAHEAMKAVLDNMYTITETPSVSRSSPSADPLTEAKTLADLLNANGSIGIKFVATKDGGVEAELNNRQVNNYNNANSRPGMAPFAELTKKFGGDIIFEPHTDKERQKQLLEVKPGNVHAALGQIGSYTKTLQGTRQVLEGQYKEAMLSLGIKPPDNMPLGNVGELPNGALAQDEKTVQRLRAATGLKVEFYRGHDGFSSPDDVHGTFKFTIPDGIDREKYINAIIAARNEAGLSTATMPITDSMGLIRNPREFYVENDGRFTETSLKLLENPTFKANIQQQLSTALLPLQASAPDRSSLRDGTNLATAVSGDMKHGDEKHHIVVRGGDGAKAERWIDRSGEKITVVAKDEIGADGKKYHVRDASIVAKDGTTYTRHDVDNKEQWAMVKTPTGEVASNVVRTPNGKQLAETIKQSDPNAARAAQVRSKAPITPS